MDDATSEIYTMILVAEEGRASTFEALREVIGERGLLAPSTPTATAITSYTRGGRQNLERGPDAGRQGSGPSGVEHIAAYSPQAPLRQAQEALRSAVRHPSGPPAHGDAACRDPIYRGGQRLG